jgi:ABC-type sugar transport system ATPase subunit
LAIRRELVELQRTTLIPCVYVTRDQPEAFALANRIAVINQGVIQQIGTRAELVNAPATLWVAQWLGFPPMNTLTGYLQGTYQTEGLCYRVWAKSVMPLLPVKWTGLLESLKLNSVILGIRPEYIIPEWEFAEKLQPSFATVRVEILASEWNQGKTIVQLQLPHPDEQFMAVFDISHDQVKIGQMLTIAFNPAHCCLFHPENQQLLHAPSGPLPTTWSVQAPRTRPFLDKFQQ